MKNYKSYLLAAAFAAMTVCAYAQTDANTYSTTDPKLTDQAMSKRLSTDLTSRDSQIGNNPVSWYDGGNGYYATYTVGQDMYMARYDKKGQYIDTYTRSDWNSADANSMVKNYYGQSEYKDQEVTGFWTSSNKKGYYLETKDNNGKTLRIYGDQSGKFSTMPPRGNTAKSSPK